MNKKIFILSFLFYGVVVGLISTQLWQISDTPFFLNIPGVLIGDIVYGLSIDFLGNPSSSQAHFTIPWVLRIPQVYIPVSIIFWGIIGLISQLIYNSKKNK